MSRSHWIRAAWAIGLVLTLAGCAAPAPAPDLVDNLNADLQAVLNDEDILALAPVEVSEARNAVRRASIEGLGEA
ncbi:MAG: hypothetical protein AAGH65_10655, partial [Pseudomonadota bacterium]